MDDDTLSLLTPRLLGDKPNTYTLTKHLGEVLLVQEGAGLNLTIVRPSIIAAMWKEPYKVESPFILSPTSPGGQGSKLSVKFKESDKLVSIENLGVRP